MADMQTTSQNAFSKNICIFWEKAKGPIDNKSALA